MSNPLRVPRGTTTSIESRVLLDGELAYDTTLEQLRVGDGVTYGGRALAGDNDFVPAALTDTAINSAIAAASAAGGGRVLLLPESYSITTGITPMSNVEVIGVRGRTKFVGATSSSSISFVSYTGAIGSTLRLNSTAALNSRTAVLTDASTIATGDIIKIQGTDATSSELHEWLTKVGGKSSNTLTLVDPMPFAIPSAGTDAINEVTTYLSNFSLRNVIFECGSNTGATTSGLSITYAVNCEFENLEFFDFVNGSGPVAYGGLNCVYTNIYTTNCGSASASAIHLYVQTALQARGLRSYEDNSFGIQLDRGAYNIASDVSCINSGHTVAGRGIKLAGLLRSALSNLISTNSAYTGLAFTNAACDNVVSNVVLISNGWNVANHGLWGANQYNTGNSVINVTAYGNSGYDLALGESTDTNNTIINAKYGTIRYDTGSSVIEASYNGESRVIGADTSAAVGPVHTVFRASPDPANSDLIGVYRYLGYDNGAAEQVYAETGATITDVTAASEDGDWHVSTVVAGTVAKRLHVGAGTYSDTATGGDPGAGKANFTELQINGVSQARFRAHKNGSDQTGIVSITLTQVTFGTEAIDVGSAYNTSTSRWTPPAGGVRMSTAIYVSAGQTAGQLLQVDIKKNSSSVASRFMEATATFNQVQLSYVDTANGTDYYEVFVYGTSGGTLTVSGNAAYTWFEGEIV